MRLNATPNATGCTTETTISEILFGSTFRSNAKNDSTRNPQILFNSELASMCTHLIDVLCGFG